ncbi:Uncharacterised protein [Candidatus Bartonella washoeensis]|uniref:hypothetical protein n=1 Tax=Candidatus Bartonella washoeensis TaxID=186739 RepID=UPI000D847421|nr:hypothetical protein [Bartonella washoeensis]SPU27793.1 Uncharacterised protein [Bartonella washoeensis]
MVGDMMRQENNKDKDLTEKEQQLLHEMINTYQGLKMMSRFMKWLAFIIFMFVIDFARLMDAIDNIFSHFKRWLTKS